MPLISIIVPVYNVEKYLSKCIESILAQTFTDFELLLIDDGTPDNSGIICDEFAKKDSRLRVIHKENGGVSSSRNTGLVLAKGQWIAFVDGDDWVGPEYIQSMIHENCDADLSMQGYKIVTDKGVNIVHQFDSKLCTNNLLEAFYESEYRNIINSPISKLFKSDIIQKYNIRFDDSISYGEDHLFVLDYLNHIKSIYITNSFEYYYYQDDSLSLTRRPIPTSSLIAYMIRTFEKQTLFINQNSNRDKFLAMNAVAWRFYGVYTKLIYDIFSSSISYEDYCSIVKRLRPYRMAKNSLNFKRKYLFDFIERAPLRTSYSVLKSLI